MSTTPARVAAVLTAAHEAGEIVWREEAYAYPWPVQVVADYSGALADTGTLPGNLSPPEAVRRLTAERDAEKARADEAVALLREIHGSPPPYRSFAEWQRSGDTVSCERVNAHDEIRDRIRAFLATQEDRR